MSVERVSPGTPIARAAGYEHRSLSDVLAATPSLVGVLNSVVVAVLLALLAVRSGPQFLSHWSSACSASSRR